MKLRTTATWATFVAVVAAIQLASAQQGVVNALATDDMMVNAHGESVVTPTGYGAPCGPGCYGPGGMPGCGPMDAGMMGGGPASLNAFGAGASMNVEQCGPHYFDFSAEYVSYELDDNPFGDNTVFSTEGFPNSVGDIPSEAVITGSDIEGGDSDGYRLIGRLDIGALSVFEVTYTGLYDTGNAEAVAFGGSANPGTTETLYSIFSGFGISTGGVIVGPDFAETDDALEHRVSFESELHSVEASYRRYWVGFNPRVSGTLLVGFRYTSLEEALSFDSRSDDGSVAIDVLGSNHLAGAQVGLDTWITVLQGLRIGVEEKVGIYNNSFDGGTGAVFGGGSANTDSFVSQSGDQVAFLSELKVMAVANLTPSLSLKGGYELLYISDVVRAGDNLLTNPPYGGASSPVNSNGEAVFHGWTIGGEYVY